MASGSTELAAAELERFLTDPTADALALIGDWGSGKTYIWNELLEKVRKNNNAARPGYAYVSLFGISSLAQLNVAIFQHSDGLREGAKTPLEASGLAKLGRLATHLKAVPVLRDYAEAAEQLMAFEIRDRVICFDDLERMSPDFSVTELMGFASFLKERRNCKVLFIAHTDKLKGKDEFEKLSEKVVDVTLRFVRQASEASAIAITEDTALAKRTRRNCTELGIKNIRVIRQIWRLVRAIEPMVRDYEPPILTQAIHSLALFGWCRLQPDIAPGEEFVLNRGDFAWMSDEQKRGLSPQEKEWSETLERYGFGSVDEFDKVLAQGVLDGYFDPAAVEATASQKSALIVSEKAGNSVTEAWATFHESFEGTEQSVATAIFDAVKKHAKFVTPLNLDGSVRMLKELGFAAKATELIDRYMRVHEANVALFDLEGYAFSGDVRDPEVIAAFGAKTGSIKDDRPPRDVLIHISKRGASKADRNLVESLTTDDLVAIFQHGGPSTRRVVNAALEFASHKPNDVDSLPQRAKAALIEIGRKSKLNRLRVKRYGITDAELDQTDAAHEDR